MGAAKVATSAIGAVAGGVVVGGGVSVEIGSGGGATPLAVPATIGGIALIGASGVIAVDGVNQISEGVKGLVSEARGLRGGQGKGERGETAVPDKPGKHTKPDPNKPGNTIVARPGAKPYTRPVREGEPGFVDKSAPPVPTIARGKKKDGNE